VGASSIINVKCTTSLTISVFMKLLRHFPSMVPPAVSCEVVRPTQPQLNLLDVGGGHVFDACNAKFLAVESLRLYAINRLVRADVGPGCGTSVRFRIDHERKTEADGNCPAGLLLHTRSSNWRWR
jgi:hypothetical protein